MTMTSSQPMKQVKRRYWIDHDGRRERVLALASESVAPKDIARAIAAEYGTCTVWTVYKILGAQ
jgi:hypothetical protein